MSLSRNVGLFLGTLALGGLAVSAASCKSADPGVAATGGVSTGGATTTATGTGGAAGAGTGGTSSTSSTGQGGVGGQAGHGGAGGAGGAGGVGGAGGEPCGGCPAGKVCDPSLGCLDCVANTDCKDASKPVCVSGTCAQCSTQFECKQTEVCSQYDHTCGKACGADTDCKNGDAAYCDPSLHFCAQCTVSSPCSSLGGVPLSCFNGRCVKCFSDAQCAGQTPLCDPGAGECVQCLAPSQCAADETCTNRACVKK